MGAPWSESAKRRVARLRKKKVKSKLLIVCCLNCKQSFSYRHYPSSKTRTFCSRTCASRYNSPLQSEVRRKNTKLIWADSEQRRIRVESMVKAGDCPRIRAKRSAAAKKTWEGNDRRRRQYSHMLKEAYATGVRVPAYRNSQFEQDWISTKKGGRFFYHSSWERLFAELLDSSKIVKKFKYEPFGIEYKWAGHKHVYFPDFWFKLRDGREFVIELRGWNRGGRGYKERNKLKAAKAYCFEKGIDFMYLFGKDCVTMLSSAAPITTLVQ